MTRRTGLAALALLAAAACGRSEAPQTTTSSGNSEELAPVDVADAKAYTEWLKQNEIARTEVDIGSGTRSAGSDAAAWALLPRGDVRPEGMRTWRMEIDMEAFEPGGFLEFRQGRKVLWRDTNPFVPTGRFVEGSVPKAVLDVLKPGEKVTWGVVYEDAKELNAVGEFKVVNKPSAAKQMERLEQNRMNARQSPELRALARNQVLVNNSLFSEALRGSMDLAAAGKVTDAFVGEAFYKIVECLRRLDLEEAPLYDAAKQLATAKTGGSMASVNGGLGASAGGGRTGLQFEYYGPKPDPKLTADPAANPTAPTPQPVPTPTPDPTPVAPEATPAPETTPGEETAGAEQVDELQRMTENDRVQAEQNVERAKRQLEKLMDRLAKIQAATGNTPGGTPPDPAAGEGPYSGPGGSLAEIQGMVRDAQGNLEQAERIAESAEAASQELARIKEQMESNNLPGANVQPPPTGENGAPPPNETGNQTPPNAPVPFVQPPPTGENGAPPPNETGNQTPPNAPAGTGLDALTTHAQALAADALAAQQHALLLAQQAEAATAANLPNAPALTLEAQNAMKYAQDRAAQARRAQELIQSLRRLRR